MTAESGQPQEVSPSEAAGATVQAVTETEARAEPSASVEPFVLPLESLESLARDAGLQWVHSDAEKVLAAQEAIASTPMPARILRQPKAIVMVDEGPLVLVETRKDLSQVRLPFDPA